ncbi:MAG TPA: N-acetyl-alpha-D-glucosaminyl L-malate synthase BshA, partial [Candidatus Hydrogenedentes bacterium]|nr:N-acetyl-alpha-D-glucosaminyl L-malate synthase BshA [Candidatus Hydrogenedentota bacterium]
MKIGVTCHPSTGGSGILATELGLAMADRGHEVHFVTLGHPFRLPEFHARVYNHAVPVITYPLFHQHPCSLALASQIAEVAEEVDIDIWHAHYAIPHAASAILARDTLAADKRFKLVTTLHGTDITLVGADPSFFRITKYSMECSDAVTAVSNWLAEETRREFSLTSPIHTIY